MIKSEGREYPKALHARKAESIPRHSMLEWERVKSEVPESSVLVRIFFLVYINDLPNNITSIIKGCG